MSWDNRAVTVTYPGLGAQAKTFYDAQGRVVDSVDENNSDTHSLYDQAGRRVSSTAGYMSPNSIETDYVYDADGNVKMVTVNGHVLSNNTYDNMNRLTRVDYPDGTYSTTEYDNDGRKTASVDQGLKRTEYSNDGQGRLTEVRQITSGGNFNTDYTYDLVGNELTQQDANLHTTHYTYDNMNRRKTRQLPGGQTEYYLSYDATGNLTSKQTFNGANISYTYDPQTDRLVAESGPGFSYGYQYDNAGDRVVMTDGTGTTHFNHDERDRITAKNSPFGNITYSYDAHENLTGILSSNPNGTNVNYEYDALNRPVTVMDVHRGIQTTSYSYDSVGNLASETLPNNVGVTYTYDALNHLLTLNSSLLTSNSQLASYNYTLGPAGNRTSVAEVSGRAVSYLYDDLYRLTAETIQNDPVTANNGTIGYGYDAVGNRQSRTSTVAPIPGQSFSGDYDSNDRLTARFGYDSDGNTTSQGVTTYTYDGLDHLTSVSAPGLSESFVYDGDGNKVSQTVNGVTTGYLIDNTNLTGYAQVLEELQGGNVNRVYTYGTNRISEDQLISGNWTLSFYGYDGQGSVRYLTNSSGIVTDTYTYDAFGNLISQMGTTPNVFLYDGEQNDNNLGQYYLRARFMNEAIGRFQTMDSYQGRPAEPLSLHKYEFASGNPGNKVDPSGRDWGGIDEEPLVLIPQNFDKNIVLQYAYHYLPLISDAEHITQPFEATIFGDTGMNFKYIVVQWKQGFISVLGSAGQVMRRDGSSDWEIDATNPYINAEYDGSLSKQNKQIIFGDNPGVSSNSPFQQGTEVRADVSFMINVYDRSKIGIPWPINATKFDFINEQFPVPVLSIPWFFDIDKIIP